MTTIPNKGIRPTPRNNAILWILGPIVYYMFSKSELCIHLLYGFQAKGALEILQKYWTFKVLWKKLGYL
jgi:hypothetical protein